MSFESNQDRVEQAVSLVRRGLSTALCEPERPARPSSEADIQRALHLLRQGRCDPAFLVRVERISTALFTINRARQNGRPNLHASQVQRLRRLAADTGLAAVAI